MTGRYEPGPDYHPDAHLADYDLGRLDEQHAQIVRRRKVVFKVRKGLEHVEVPEELKRFELRYFPMDIELIFIPPSQICVLVKTHDRATGKVTEVDHIFGLSGLEHRTPRGFKFLEKEVKHAIWEAVRHELTEAWHADGKPARG